MLKSLFNIVAGLQACNFITKRLHNRCLPVNIAKFFKTSVLKDICEWLLLNFINSKWKMKHLSWTFCKNSWQYLTVDYFCKTLHIISFRGLWICFDKTKQNPIVLSFISQKIRTAISAKLFLKIQFYLHIITLLWDINHRFKTRVFHLKLINPCSWIHIILVTHY